MSAKTISFPKGRGHLTHNNREFISKNVVPERTPWNRIYIQEPLESAYETCFGQALRAYNATQKRSDRKKENYLREIENSRNGEKPFYENVVQVGKMTDTPVVDENGNLTEDAEIAIEVLEKYAKTFQERNPNLYMFNCVMHLDEATPHLHIDYIPVAHGYKKGMETRNSLTKAFQQMGFAKAVSKKQNETVAWQQREREYLTELCQEKGIEIEVLGVKRDNLSLPEYKAAMREVESLEKKAETLDTANTVLEQHNEDLQEQVQEKEEQCHDLTMQAEELTKQIDELEAKETRNQEILAKHDLRASALKEVSKKADAETKKMKSVAVPVNSIFGGEEYVKIKKNDWNKIMDTFNRAVSRNYLLGKYEKKISVLEKEMVKFTDMLDKVKSFLKVKGLEEKFSEFLESLEPKSIKQKIEENKKTKKERQQGGEILEQERVGKKKRIQQEI